MEKGNCYPLVANERYLYKNSSNTEIILRIKNLNKKIFENGAVQLAEIDDSSRASHKELSNGHFVITAVIKDDNAAKNSADLFVQLERLLSGFVRGIANGLNYLVQTSLRAVGGEKVTTTVDIDSIIFNHYPDTSINFFNTNKSTVGSQIDKQPEKLSKMISMFRDAANTWYGRFSGIAVAGYLVILLYVGVKILLGTTGDNKAQYKELLTYWISGLILLVFFPYVIKFAISINISLVSEVEEAKRTVLKIEYKPSQIDMSGFDLPTEADMDDYTAISSQMDSVPYNQNDTSYMAQIALRAERTQGLVDAIVYLIMVIQFIMIVIMYYKRVFMIAFLILIFPFVALAYAVDKIIDDKAQAFSVWCRELMINIFIQSIHALIYVFVMGAVYANGAYSGDWLLAIVGITFLFNGEQILKKIIGQEGNTIKSLRDTAVRTAATITAGRKVVSSIKDNYIGRDSHLGRTIEAHRRYRTEKLIAKNMDFLVPKNTSTNSTPSRNNIGNAGNSGNGMLLGGFAPSGGTLENSVDTLNNMNRNTDPAQIGNALDDVLENRTNTGAYSTMNRLNLSEDQLRLLDKARQDLVNGAIEAKKGDPKNYASAKQRLDADLDLKFEVIFPNDIEKRQIMKRALYHNLRDGNRDNKHKARVLSREAVKSEITKVKNRRKAFYNPDHIKLQSGITNPFSQKAKPTELSKAGQKTKSKVLSNYDPKNITETEEKYAESVAILKDFSNLNHATSANVEKYTSKQVMDATEYIVKHENDSDTNRRIARDILGVTGKEARAIVSEEVGRQYTNISDKTHPKNFRKDINRGVKKTKIEGGTKNEVRRAQKNIEKSLEKAIENIREDEINMRNDICSIDALDEVTMVEYLKNEREAGYSEYTYADAIIDERDHENYNEIVMVEDFAAEQLEDIPYNINIPTYEGLTQEEHEAKAKALKKKFYEELTRTGATTTGVILGTTIGAGINIGLSDDKPALEEALLGAAGGAFMGDALAENALGKLKETKRIKIINPYTGEIEEYDVKNKGITKEVWGKINENEILSVNDYRLAEGKLRYDLDIKFLEGKAKYERRQQAERRRQMYDEALRNSNNRSNSN